MWSPVQDRLTNSVQNLVVADFDGNGYPDVATDCTNSGCWRISYRDENEKMSEWKSYLQPVSLRGDIAGVGHFRGKQAKSADILTWNHGQRCDQGSSQDTLCIAVAASQRVVSLHAPDMR
jgi:hypothetical protein